jgi:thiol-disulfide isomerase/thioredoxin
MIKIILLIIPLQLSAILGMAQRASVIKLPELQQLLASPNDTTYVVNFMATWCKPCMEEIPFFEKAAQDVSGKKFKLVYVSLDAVGDLDKKLNALLSRKKIMNTTFLLDEPDYNSWIDTVEPTWDGAIPVTFVFNNQKKTRKFIKNATTYQHLSSSIQEQLNQ